MEADEQFNDHDSTFGGDRESLASSTTSIQSAITKYTFEHGRRYHAYNAGSYNFPNDEQESNRMDIEHHNQKLQIDGKLHLCPLPEQPQEILDLGTGTGIWAIEMADAHPDCQVYGTDLSPIQPSWVPPNCKFEIDDFNQEWTWGENRFDMIHCRLFLGSVSSYPDLYKQAYAALKPGGWIELSDVETMVYSNDGTVTEDMAVVKWSKLWDDAVGKVGKRIPKAEEYHSMLKDAGFADVHWQLIQRPTNDWPKDPKLKEIGMFTHANYMEGLEAFTMALFTRIHGWKPEEVQVLLAQIRTEWKKRKIHGWQKGMRAYAQKPLTRQ